MNERGRILEEVMTETGTTQTRLSRLSGVHQPSISQFLSGRTDLSDDKLDRSWSAWAIGSRSSAARSSPS